MSSSNTGEILQKWYSAKEKLEILEEKIKKYKLAIAKEMNKKEVDKISEKGFVVSRRRNTRSYLTKDNVPAAIWKEYATKSHYDAFFLTKK